MEAAVDVVFDVIRVRLVVQQPCLELGPAAGLLGEVWDLILPDPGLQSKPSHFHSKTGLCFSCATIELDTVRQNC